MAKLKCIHSFIHYLVLSHPLVKGWPHSDQFAAIDSSPLPLVPSDTHLACRSFTIALDVVNLLLLVRHPVLQTACHLYEIEVSLRMATSRRILAFLLYRTRKIRQNKCLWGTKRKQRKKKIIYTALKIHLICHTLTKLHSRHKLVQHELVSDRWVLSVGERNYAGNDLDDRSVPVPAFQRLRG